MTNSEPLELFEDSGQVADGRIVQCDSHHVIVEIEAVRDKLAGVEIIIASAVPKGDRADWMVEKLSELGVSRFIPLAAERSVVLPTGQNKRDRWIRIATESAKQSRRAGVMKVDELTSVAEAIKGQRDEGRGQNKGAAARGFYLSTETGAMPVVSTLPSALTPHSSALIFLIGPEGGWSPPELSRFEAFHLTGVKLTGTILRVETAAVTAAAIVACQLEIPQGK